jgi:hypothetical protein
MSSHSFATTTEILPSTAAEVTDVIAVFRDPSRSYSHESLMRVWQRLNTWADEEARSARTYRRLADTADLHAAGRGPQARKGVHMRGGRRGAHEAAPRLLADVDQSQLRAADRYGGNRPNRRIGWLCGGGDGQIHAGREHVNLLVVVDQFEELFRYRQLGAAGREGDQGTGEEATAFAIEGPVGVGGAEIVPVLLTRLVNDVPPARRRAPRCSP